MMLDIMVAVPTSKKRDGLPGGEVAVRFLAAALAQPRVKALMSTEHISVAGTLLEASASTKRRRPKDGSGQPPNVGRDGANDFYGDRPAALYLVAPHADWPCAVTLGGDKVFDSRDFVADLGEISVTPHVAQNTSARRSPIDGRTTGTRATVSACASGSGSRRPWVPSPDYSPRLADMAQLLDWP